MKFGQLVECNIRSILLEESCTKCGEETISRPFTKKIEIENISLDQSFIQLVFIVSQVEGYQNILKLSCKLLAITSYKAFLKNKKKSGANLPVPFSA